MNPPKGLCLMLAGIFILSGCTIVEGAPIRLVIAGQYTYVNTYDGSAWTYDIPIDPVNWSITATFDDTVVSTSEYSGTDFLTKDTFFTIPATVTPSPMTDDLLARMGSVPIAQTYSSAYAEQTWRGPASTGVKQVRAGELASTDDFDLSPNISKSYFYSRWVGPDAVGAASGITGIGDVDYFDSVTLWQFLQEAMANGYPVWNSEYIGVSFYDLDRQTSGWEWATQYAGSGTLVSVERVPEPSSPGLIAAGLLGVALASLKRR